MSRPAYSLLRKRTDEEASVSFSELLFDLIYVFAVTQLSHYLLHNLSWLGFLQETILWFAVWMAWQHTVWVTNWFNPDTKSVRIILFTIMLVGLIMSSAIPEAFTSRAKIFSFCFVAIQIGRALCIVLLLGNKHTLSYNYRRILGWAFISSIFWIWGAYQDGLPRFILWLIAVTADYTSPMFGFYLPFLGKSSSKTDWNVEGHHLAERSQLFVIIAFGETILMTGDSLS